jgi:hypothetical protein
MKKVIISVFVILTLGVISCVQNDSSGDDIVSLEKAKLPNREWIKLKCGLFLKNDGVLAFASRPDLVFTSQSKTDPDECPNVFITELGSYEDSIRPNLKELVDTMTFQSVGADFYKDKNHIYMHYDMCDGGYLRIFSDDTASFRLLGGQYMVFKSNVYHYRAGRMDADAATFRVFKETGNIAKDKNGYFSFYERVTETEIKEGMDEEQFKRLMAL